jgi:hypothetical protein
MPTLVEINGRALIRVAGSDWRSFLQGLITHDVERLDGGQARFAALLTPQGKFLADLFVIATEDGALLDVQRDRRDELLRRLTMYRLRAKVEIGVEDGLAVLAFLSASPANAGVQITGRDGMWVEDPRLPALGLRGYAPYDLGPGIRPESGGEEAYDRHRLALGVPDPAQDCIPDKTYPIEANFDLLNGVDFKKGCFVGQETTSRMKRRGQIKNRMLPIVFGGAAPPFGTEVLNGDLRAGEVLSGREGRAMALVRLDRLDGALTADGRPVAIERPSWFMERSSV